MYGGQAERRLLKPHQSEQSVWTAGNASRAQLANDRDRRIDCEMERSWHSLVVSRRRQHLAAFTRLILGRRSTLVLPCICQRRRCLGSGSRAELPVEDRRMMWSSCCRSWGRQSGIGGNCGGVLVLNGAAGSVLVVMDRRVSCDEGITSALHDHARNGCGMSWRFRNLRSCEGVAMRSRTYAVHVVLKSVSDAATANNRDLKCDLVTDHEVVIPVFRSRDCWLRS